MEVIEKITKSLKAGGAIKINENIESYLIEILKLNNKYVVNNNLRQANNNELLSPSLLFEKIFYDYITVLKNNTNEQPKNVKDVLLNTLKGIEEEINLFIDNYYNYQENEIPEQQVILKDKLEDCLLQLNINENEIKESIELLNNTIKVKQSQNLEVERLKQEIEQLKLDNQLLQDQVNNNSNTSNGLFINNTQNTNNENLNNNHNNINDDYIDSIIDKVCRKLNNEDITDTLIIENNVNAIEQKLDLALIMLEYSINDTKLFGKANHTIGKSDTYKLAQKILEQNSIIVIDNNLKKLVNKDLKTL